MSRQSFLFGATSFQRRRDITEDETKQALVIMKPTNEHVTVDTKVATTVTKGSAYISPSASTTSGKPPASDSKLPISESIPLGMVNEKDVLIQSSIPGKKEVGLSRKSCARIGKAFVEEAGAMARSIGFFDGVGIILGCIIGSGIFIAPAGVQKEAGSIGESLIIWLLAGLFVMLGSFCYIELGVLLRESGGDYAYIFYAFGSLVSFLRLWVEAVVVRPGTEAVVALTFATYMVKPFANSHEAVLMIAVSMILFLTFLNCISIKSSLMINNVCTVAKLVALVGIVLVGVYALFALEDGTASFDDLFYGSNWHPGSIARAFYSALFAYQGWNYLNFIMEEVKEPTKNLPRAVITSMVIVIAVYLLVNIAFYTGLRPYELVSSEAAAIDFAMKVTGLQWSSIVVSFIVAISCFGSGNGVIYTSSRLFYVGARNNHMPKVLQFTSPQYRTPIPAIILTGAISLCFLLLSSNPIQIINYIAISYWLAIGTAIAALFYFRYIIPKEEYPYRVSLITAIIFFAGCCFLVIFPFFSAWDEACIGMAIMASGAPVYLLFIRYRMAFLDKQADLLTIIAQTLLLVENEPVGDSNVIESK